MSVDERVIKYAGGNTNLSKFKELLDADKNMNYVSINWNLHPKLKKIISRITNRYVRLVKAYKMVARLKNKQKV